MDEPWFRLLTYWQNDQWRHALTIPFLIGALRTPPGSPFASDESPRSNLRALIDAIRSHHPDGYYLRIYRCPDLGQLVLRQVKGSPDHLSVPIPSPSDRQCVLYTSDGVGRSSDSPFEDLVETIWNECGEAIRSGDYSCRGGNFVKLNEYELNIISVALA